MHHNVGWVLELMYAGCDSSLMARVCWLPPLKWPAIPLDQAGVGLEEGLRRGRVGIGRWGTRGDQGDQGRPGGPRGSQEVEAGG